MKTPNLHSIQNYSTEEIDNIFIGVIHQNQQSNEWKVTILLNKQKAKFKIDMGAQCNVIPKWIYWQECKEPLKVSTVNLVTFSGHKLNTSGKAHIQCTYKCHHYDVEFEVTDKDVHNILGLHTHMH